LRQDRGSGNSRKKKLKKKPTYGPPTPAGRGNVAGPPTPKRAGTGGQAGPPTPPRLRSKEAQDAERAKKRTAGPPTPKRLTPVRQEIERRRGKERLRMGPPTPDRFKTKNVPVNRVAQLRNLRTRLEEVGGESEVGKRDPVTGRKYRTTVEQLAGQVRYRSMSDKQRDAYKKRLIQSAGSRKSGVDAAVSAPAAKALEQTTRPLHAVAGGVDAAVRGENVLKGAERGITLKDRKTFSDVLKSAGVKNKTVAGVAGFGLDLVADPLTYGKLTRLSPKQHATRQAQRSTVDAAKATTKAAKAEAKGQTRKAARKTKQAEKHGARAQAKMKRAEKASDATGIQAGFSGKVPFGPRFEVSTKGKATARVGKKLAPAAEAGRSSKVGRVMNALVRPTARRPKLTREQDEAFRYAERKRRAGQAAADRKSFRRGQAYTRFKVDDAAVIRARERAAKEPLLDTRQAKRRTVEHKTLTSAKRKLEVARRREQRERGRVEVASRASQRKTLGIALARLDKGKIKSPVAREAVERFKDAAKARNEAARELSAARKVYRNAHWQGGARRSGARTLYTAEERKAATSRLKVAERVMEQANDAYKVARAQLDRAAEIEAGRRAARQESDQIANLNRQPPRTLSRLERARGEVQRAETNLAAAREAAKGKRKTERVLVDSKTGKPYAEAMAGAERYGLDDLPAKERAVAETLGDELDTLKVRQKQAGTLKAERENYFPHRVKPTSTLSRIRRGKIAKNPYAKERTDPRPIHEIEAERAAKGKPQLFTEDIAPTVAEYTQKAERAIVDANFLKEVKAIGKPLNADTLRRMTDDEGLYRITGDGFAPVRQPNGRDLDADQVKALIDAGEDVTILPRTIGDTIEQAGSRRLEATREAIRFINKPQQWWKGIVTVLNVPFYYARNAMDDTFRMWESDGDLVSLIRAGRAIKELALHERRLGRQLRPEDVKGTIMVGGKEVPLRRFLDEAIEDGATRTGFFAGSDLPEESLKSAGRKLKPMQKVRQWGQNMEDIPRLASYLSARNRGYTRREAASHVRLYMFDYDELTDVERALRATAIPFYTYMRKNTALQAQMLVSRPGKLAAIEKARLEANKLGTDSDEYRATVDRLAKTGAYTKDELERLRRGEFEPFLTAKDQQAVPIVVDGKLVYPPLGITDLNRIPLATTWETLKELPRTEWDLAMQMLGPAIKLPVEFFQNYSFFFKDAIFRDKDNPEAERWVPAPTWASKIPGMEGLVVTRKDKATGKTIPQWPAKFDYFIRALGPQLGFATTIATPTKNQRGQSAKDRLVTQATGIRFVDLEHRLIAGAMERAFNRLGEIRARKADLDDTPKGKSSDGFYYSREYQRLVNEEQRLTKVIDRLRAAQTGVKPKEPKRLERRPLPPQAEMEKEFREFEKELADPEAEFREFERDLRKEQARQRIVSGK
jgi:hypothetical protein